MERQKLTCDYDKRLCPFPLVKEFNGCKECPVYLDMPVPWDAQKEVKHGEEV